jgi:hypothetical protein
MDEYELARWTYAPAGRNMVASGARRCDRVFEDFDADFRCPAGEEAEPDEAPGQPPR